MSFSTAQLSLSSKLVSPVAHRPAVRHTIRSRGALQVQNATLWSLQYKGKEIEITSEVGQKDVCTVGGKSATEQDKEFSEVTGLNIQFIASGESDPTDSPSDLKIKNIDSEPEITVDGAKVGHGEEKLLSVGAKINIGGKAEYQVLRNVRTHA